MAQASEEVVGKGGEEAAFHPAPCAMHALSLSLSQCVCVCRPGLTAVSSLSPMADPPPSIPSAVRRAWGGLAEPPGLARPSKSLSLALTSPLSYPAAQEKIRTMPSLVGISPTHATGHIPMLA